MLTNHSSIIMIENAASFVKETFCQYLKDCEFIQSLTGHIENSDSERAERIYNYLKSLQ